MAQFAAGTITAATGTFSNQVRDDYGTFVTISGSAYTGLSLAFFGSRDGGATFPFPLAAVLDDALTLVSGTISPADGSAHGYHVLSQGCNAVQVKASALTNAGPVNVGIGSDYSFFGQQPLVLTVNTGGAVSIGTVTQGTAAAASGYWPVRLTDGTNVAPSFDAAARAGFVKVTNGTQTMPTMDAAARAGFFQLTDGTNTAPTMDSAARAGFQKLTDGTNAVTLAQFHNTDNQSLGGTAYGLTVGGVTQILNSAGNLDRQRETGADGIPALGITTGAAQFAMSFQTTDAESVASGNAAVFTPAAMSGAIMGTPWSIQVGSVLILDAGTFTVTLGTQSSGTFTLSFNGQTTGTIAFGATAATVQTALRGLTSIGGTNATVSGSAGGPYTVKLSPTLDGLSAGLTANFASLTTPANASLTTAKETVVVTATTATTFTCKTANSHNGTSVAVAVWGYVFNQERDATGELDGASGSGTAVAVEYEFNGGAVAGARSLDRERNLQGKGLGSQGSMTPNAGDTTLTIGTPTGIMPGTQIQLSGSGTTEVVYVANSYAVGSTSVPISSPVVNASQTTAKWSKFAETGPGLNTFLADGEGLEVAGIFDNGSGNYALMRSSSADAMAAANIPAENPALYNGATFDRGRSGSATNLANTSGTGSELTTTPGQWSVTNAPAVATQATGTKAAGGAGVRHVCTGLVLTLANDSTGSVQTLLAFNLRDGASGAGAVLATFTLALPATAGECRTLAVSGLNIPGTAATAMCLESASATAAHTAASVTFFGYDAS